MEETIIRCTADIQNKIYEAGLFRPEEKVVLATKDCVLLEHFTGKTYGYRMVDLTTLKAKRLFSRQKPLTQEGYERAIEKMLALVSESPVQESPVQEPTAQEAPVQESPLQESPAYADKRERARALLTYVFTDILPRHGMYLRENQLSLALSMLDAIWDGRVALCEAEVGTGKTHAYILAAMVYRLFNPGARAVLISTSTIALQRALTEEYIPQISDILMEHRITDQPLTFVVRKGKAHYACLDRVRNYLSSLRHNDRPEDRGLMETLTALAVGECSFDLDALPLTNYVRERICVERCHYHCGLSTLCPYRSFLRRTQTSGYDFQIVNHNLVLADILSQKGGRSRLLPPSGLIIFDEAHKLLDAARQMYGMEFCSTELEQVAASVCRAAVSGMNKKEILRLRGEMLRLNTLLFETLKQEAGTRYDKTSQAVSFTPAITRILRALAEVLCRLSPCFQSAKRYTPLAGRIDQKQAKLMVLLEHAQSICWLEHTGVTACQVCALPKELDYLLYEDIWNGGIPCVLTSATLSIGGDFSHFMHQTGIDLLEQHRLLMTSKASPFDYENHALLYLPEDMPFPNTKNSDYMTAVLKRLTELIRQSHGHTLVLFTSYRMMEIIYQELQKPQAVDYPLFCMGKGQLETLAAFRKSGNGVLLASDSAGEGIDLAGDILSSLVVVKLPFPMPDPVSEYERSLHDDFHSYLSESIVPSMLIKLRQWIGRGIRRETDTCVFSILDSRASGRYRNDILAALPDMPVTDRMEDVGRFVLEKKSDAYFQ